MLTQQLVNNQRQKLEQEKLTSARLWKKSIERAKEQYQKRKEAASAFTKVVNTVINQKGFAIFM